MERGYIIGEDTKRVFIATMKTTNEKTGDMVQVWILAKNEKPYDLLKAGKDGIVCGSCPLKSGAGCYVTVFQAPTQIYKAYKAGKYSTNYDEFLEIVQNKFVRFGAYGDPSFIPFKTLFQIASRCKGYTGYSHQWKNKNFDAKLLTILHASIDHENDIAILNKLHPTAKYFRLVDNYADIKENEIVCLSDSMGVQCRDCLKCSGSSSDNIVIEKHGVNAKKITTKVAA